MFLALKEIQRSPLRFGLIAAITALLSFLMVMLTGLTLGLARQNTAAFDSWNMAGISLSSDADGQLRASALTEAEVDQLTHGVSTRTAVVGYSPVRLTSDSRQIQATFIGVNSQEFIAQGLHLTSGRLPEKTDEIVVDSDQQDQAQVHVGDQLGVVDSAKKFTVVGFVKDAKMNVGPVVYGTLEGWKTLRELPASIVASGVAFTGETPTSIAGVQSWDINAFRHKIPGYDAQNQTFITLISILAFVSLIINGVFLYILMIQKIPMIAVLKAQGISSKVLGRSAIFQSVAISLISILAALGAAALVSMLLPSGIPVSFHWPLIGTLCAGLLGISVVGSLVPLRQIRRVDPSALIGA